MKVCVFGLGEAGALIAADLCAAGASVRAYDPAPVATPQSVVRCESPKSAVMDAELIMSITPGADAMAAVGQALNEIGEHALYADLSTNSPGVKRQLAEICSRRSILFTDVALMAMVPGKGLRTPMLTSGEGADQYLQRVAPLGAEVQVVSKIPGQAAARKLLRSVMMKGLAAVIVEAMQAASVDNCGPWLWQNICEELTAADEMFVERLVKGTDIHATRRLHEMEAASAYLQELGIEPNMTGSTVASLKKIVLTGFLEF